MEWSSYIDIRYREQKERMRQAQMANLYIMYVLALCYDIVKKFRNWVELQIF